MGSLRASLTTALVLLALCVTDQLATAARSTPTPAVASKKPQPSRSLHGLTIAPGGGKAGNLRVLVVNDIPGHLEVLGCLLHMLKSGGIKPTTLYTGPQQLLHTLGLFEWLGYNTEDVQPTDEQLTTAEKHGSYGYDVQDLGHFHNLPSGQVTMPDGLKADLVICVTPELGRGECSQVVTALRPAQVITWVHRGDMVNDNVLNIYPRQSLVALSPHVANAVTEASDMPTEWALPIAPHQENEAPCNSLSCLHGFVMQGTIRGVNARAVGKGHTRDYRTLWDRLLELRRTRTRSMRRLHVTVLGRGQASHLEVPSKLASKVSHLSGLPYPEFWSNIHHSLALLTCFGMDTYYTSRLSSTITASLITGTPLIADKRLLATYTFLTEEHVFLQQDGEDEAAAMLRIMRMSEEEVFSRRRALAKLRDTLNARSQQTLMNWLKATQQSITQGPVQLPSVQEEQQQQLAGQQQEEPIKKSS